MSRLTSLLIAAPLAAGLLAAPSAHAEWRHHGGWGGGYGHWDHRGPGPLVGALVGLGVGAAIGGAIAAPYYAPPPVYYAPPPYGYAAPPAYYAPPPPPGW
jgi:hypothetical protein